MRFGFIFFAAAVALLASSEAAPVHPTHRSLRTFVDEEERGIPDGKDHFAIKRLEMMLTKEAYKNTKFGLWSTEGYNLEAIKSILEEKGKHYKTLADQYFLFKNPGK